jgi:hypothetical protein
MNDLAVTSSIHDAQKHEHITRHLAQFAEAGARCQHALTQNWSLRQLASTLLRDRLLHFQAELDLVVVNPDAIFFNRRDEQGDLRSVALTDLLIDVMRSGQSVMSAPGGAFYTRHDTLDPEYALSAAQRQEMEATLGRFAGILAESYQAHLNALWRKQVQSPEDPQVYQSTAEILADQQRLTLQSELALSECFTTLSLAERERLDSVIIGAVTGGVFGVSCVKGDGGHLAIPSACVVSGLPHEGDEPAGVVFLVLPGRGVERFDSVESLRQALSDKLAAQHDDSLREHLLIADQMQLAAEEPVQPQAWQLEARQSSLVEACVEGLQHKQTQDCRFLFDQDASELPADAFHAQLEQVRKCSHLDDAMGQRFNALLAETGEVVEPHWRKFADPEQKAHLIRLEQAQQQRKREVERLLGVAASLESFAHEQITTYIQARLGCFIDPGKVRLSVHDTIGLVDGDALAAQYDHSLLEFAVKGLPFTHDGIELSPPPGQLHAEFSEQFVRTMLDDLNLHQRHVAVLQEAFTNEQVLRAMTLHRDSAIALGAQAALMQGHMTQDRSHELLHMIRGDMAKPDTNHIMGSLHLADTHSRFRDLIVFEEKTQADEHFVLYAPGAPGGQDFFEFGTWRQLSIQVGEWFASPAGRSFLHDQLTGRAEVGINAVLNNVQLKPTLWGQESLIFVQCDGVDFESRLREVVRLKALRTLEGLSVPSTETNPPSAYASPAVLALVRGRIEALNNEFARLSPGLITLRDYVHQQTSDALNQFLRSLGYTRQIDPDTLYLGLSLPYYETPDFGEHSHLRSLTDLMMYGDEDVLSHRPQIHLYSSTGLNLTRLPVGVVKFIDKQIREVDLGARYMDFLSESFLGRHHPLYRQRKSLVAKRIQYEMVEAALTAFLRGDLDESRYSRMRQIINGLSASSAKPGTQAVGAVTTFKIDGQIVEGVYIFQDFEQPGDRLLYTPQAPDGRSLRPLTDFADLLALAPMQGYFSARVAHDGQRRVLRFFDEFHRGGKHDPDFVRVKDGDRIVDAHRLYDDLIERMIADTDSQTESLAEKRLALAWTIIKWTGTIVLLPFPTASFAWNVLTTSVAFYQGVEAYIAGDHATAIPLLVAGVLGVVSGGDSVRALINGGQTVAKGIGTTAGIWVWRKLDLEKAFTLPA